MLAVVVYHSSASNAFISSYVIDITVLLSSEKALLQNFRID